ncbi:hypothetical protein [Halanaerobium sp. ST460_2HS_T2]|uniref:hypothetical protein n=1 Tax=Halanaerobium sp. ST460_2HS_T2 TaxID=2183914 RepID=UPI000DF4C04C|nr:hypothetical protein [Halanaerobium sp. ST460_2HS_T2]RCW52332.1 hypothetical protein DFR80_13024 [Halanaerobium sp. ST460_2HS_T2]
MKKMLTIGLTMLLVLSLSAVGMAYEYGKDGDQGATVGVGVTVLPYMDVWYDSPVDYDGLFAGDIEGMPGIYISDGTATNTSALNLWGPAGAVAGDIITAYNPGESTKYVEMFKVEANTHVEVMLEVDWTNWMNTPTFFRVSSDENDIKGIGDWADELARVRNTPTYKPETPQEFKDIIDSHNGTDLDNSFDVDFADYLCEGPLEFHVNAGLWLLKIGQVLADDYSADVTVTVAAFMP